MYMNMVSLVVMCVRECACVENGMGAQVSMHLWQKCAFVWKERHECTYICIFGSGVCVCACMRSCMCAYLLACRCMCEIGSMGLHISMHL